jgi:hypothetical protein
VIQRGGTSKGVFFHKSDLPPTGPHQDALLMRLLGSPDVLQIDGLGGSRLLPLLPLPLLPPPLLPPPPLCASARVELNARTVASANVVRFMVVSRG